MLPSNIAETEVGAISVDTRNDGHLRGIVIFTRSATHRAEATEHARIAQTSRLTTSVSDSHGPLGARHFVSRLMTFCTNRSSSKNTGRHRSE